MKLKQFIIFSTADIGIINYNSNTQILKINIISYLDADIEDCLLSIPFYIIKCDFIKIESLTNPFDDYCNLIVFLIGFI